MAVPELPLLKPWYRVLRHEERVLLEHGRTVVVFEGAAAREFLPALLPLLDGTHTLDELCELLGRNVAPAIENALGLLATRGLLTAGPGRPLNPEHRRLAASLAAESARDDPLDEIAGRLGAATVSLLGDADALDPLARLLHQSAVGAVRREQQPGRGSSLVVAGPGADRASWNRLALERGIDWLPFGELDGGAITIGPLIVPHETACFECLLLRRESTSGCAEELAFFRGCAAPAPPRPSVLGLATALAAELVLRWLGTRDPSLPGALFTISGLDGISLDTHRVLRVPRCGACSGAAGVAQPSPWHEARVA
jgi:bacteriocin biosynthesis cyclodehydratase domain-containing protein